MRAAIVIYFFTISTYLFGQPSPTLTNVDQHLNSIYSETQARINKGETCNSVLKELNTLSSPINLTRTTPITFLADGLAKFLVKRTKEELTISAFNKFEHLLSKDTFYLKTFLPTTREKLSSISNEIYDFDLYIHALRDAFVRDLNRLPQHLQTFLMFNESLIEDPEVRAVLLDGLYLSQQVLEGKEINRIIKDYVNSGSFILKTDSLITTKAGFTTKAGIQMLGLLWSAIVNKQGEFISMEDFRSIMLDETARCIYFKLIAERASQIHYKTDHKLASLLPGQDSLEIKMLELMLIVEDIKEVIKILKKPDKSGYEDYAKYVNAFIDVMTFGYDLAKMHSKSLSREPKPMFFLILDHVNSAMLKIEQRKYSSAIEDLRKILNISNGVVTDKGQEHQKTLEAKLDSLKDKALTNDKITKKDLKDVKTKNHKTKHAQKTPEVKLDNLTDKTLINYKTTKKDLEDVKIKNEKTKHAQKTLDIALKYITFVATVAEATNSDEVAQAIETFALPAGSSVTKRYSTFTFSLNAYTGGVYGYETLSVNEADQRNVISSLTAPVGVGISKDYSYTLCKKVSHNSFNAFVSLIDVGSIFTYRFDDAQTEDLPEITLENIFAPGLFIESSLFNSPFTLGLGHQWSPGIRKITPLDGMSPTLETSHDARRWIIALKLDLPLVYLAKGR